MLRCATLTTNPNIDSTVFVRVGFSGRNDESATQAGTSRLLRPEHANRLLRPERTSRLLRPERVDFSGPFGEHELVRARQPPIFDQLPDPVPDVPRGLATLAVPPVLY